MSAQTSPSAKPTSTPPQAAAKPWLLEAPPPEGVAVYDSQRPRTQRAAVWSAGMLIALPVRILFATGFMLLLTGIVTSPALLPDSLYYDPEFAVLLMQAGGCGLVGGAVLSILALGLHYQCGGTPITREDLEDEDAGILAHAAAAHAQAQSALAALKVEARALSTPELGDELWVSAQLCREASSLQRGARDAEHAAREAAAAATHAARSAAWVRVEGLRAVTAEAEELLRGVRTQARTNRHVLDTGPLLRRVDALHALASTPAASREAAEQLAMIAEAYEELPRTPGAAVELES